MLVNISVSVCNALRVWVSGGGTSGFRCVCLSAEVRSFAVAMRMSVELAVGILRLCGNQSTVFAMRDELVAGQYTM